ncbi:hypothetical protein KGF56_001280 [Candida oxycetoniae]|uniref:Uncharacterized protein n=1 Tax=Candida oxycetoniae TaxID=497107 RepID=A0AAI9T0Q1_9ASCO|nr:uncharacterized protein KGF56_001280 [Candida oxycetoniae]KAI3406061.2 hypothetical protein KGF56_001280 [Candida oxycetoniae]
MADESIHELTSTSNSITSESTLKEVPEQAQFDQVLENIESGARDAVESKDYLSYSTLLDIYLQEPKRYSKEQRELLLECVLKTLEKNPELTFEIGWDLPSIIIAYVDSDFDFSVGIRKAPCIYKVLKIFEVLAKEGNPKELFLKSCELLETLNVNLEDKVDDYVQLQQENFFDIKVYCVNELIDASMKKIRTLYPSRFVAMAVASFINLVYNLNQSSCSIENYRFVLRRAYVFVRNYSGLPEPSDLSQHSKEDLERVRSDEAYLQRKLLTGFSTNIITICTKCHADGFALDHFCRLQKRSGKTPIYDFEYQNAIMDRWVELANSFDLYLKNIFEKFIKETNDLFRQVELNADDATEMLFEKCIVDYQNNIYTNVVNTTATTINNSILGELILFTASAMRKEQQQQEQQQQQHMHGVSIEFRDVIYMALRLVIPQMVQSAYNHKTVQDVVLYWIWFVLSQKEIYPKKSSSIQIDIASTPKVFLLVFYQSLLFILTDNDTPVARYMILTLLTKLLYLSPESIGYEFIKDTLENCPYESVRPALIGTFKELLLISRNDDDVVEDLNLDKASLGSTNSGGASSSSPPSPPPPPKLPPRQSSISYGKHYTLNKEKLSDMLELMLMAHSNCIVVKDKEVSIDSKKLSTLAAYLNFFVGLKRHNVVVENKNKIEKVLSIIEKDLTQVKEHNANQFEKNAAAMLQLTIERFRE